MAAKEESKVTTVITPLLGSPSSQGIQFTTTGLIHGDDLLQRLGDILDEYNLRGDYSETEESQFNYLLTAARHNVRGSGQHDWMKLKDAALLNTTTTRGRFLAWLYDNWQRNNITTLELSNIYIRNFHKGKPTDDDTSTSLLNTILGAEENNDYHVDKLMADIFFDAGLQVYSIEVYSGFIRHTRLD